MALEPAARPGQAHLMRLRGVAHPTGEANDYDGLFLTKEQIEERSRDVVGTPIWCEHDGAQKVGWVTAGSVDDKNQLVVDAVIDRDSTEGARVARALRSGKLTGLSLGLDHTVREDPETGIRRVVAKTIGELSVTAAPDRPDTFISEVAPESQMWDLTRQRVVSGLEKHRTKNALNKKRAELLGLFKQAASDLKTERGATQLNSVHTKVGVEDIPTTGRQARDDDDTSMSALDDQQQQQTPAPAQAQGQGDLSEVAAMQQKLAQVEADKQKLLQQLSESEELVGMIRADPNKVKDLIARDAAEEAAEQKEMGENEQSLIDRVTADMIAAGVVPENNPEIFDAIKSGKDHPKNYRPLYQLLKTTAGAASEKRATEMEVQYQEKNAEASRINEENAALKQRLGEADATRLKLEAQFQKQQDFEQRKTQYAAQVTGHAENPASRKRARTDADMHQEAATSAASSAAPVPDNALFFGGGGTAPASYGDVHAPRVHDFMADTSDEVSSRLLDLFAQGRNRTGMGRFDVPGLTGKDFGKVTEGLGADGSIDPRAHEIRSARPPIAFAADMPHQA